MSPVLWVFLRETSSVVLHFSNIAVLCPHFLLLMLFWPVYFSAALTAVPSICFMVSRWLLCFNNSHVFKFVLPFRSNTLHLHTGQMRETSGILGFYICPVGVWMAFTGHSLPFIPLFSLHVSNMIASPRTEVHSLQSSLVLSPSMNKQSKQACKRGGGVGWFL